MYGSTIGRGVLAGILLFTGLSSVTPPSGGVNPTEWLVGVALADDDDDDDDDGPRMFRIPRMMQVPRHARPRVRRPRAERSRPRQRRTPIVHERRVPREFVATGVTDEGLVRLRNAGFTIVAERRLSTLPDITVRVRIPRNLSESRARQRLQSLIPSAIVDYSTAAAGGRAVRAHVSPCSI